MQRKPEKGFALIAIIVIIAILAIGGIILYSAKPKDVVAPTDGILPTTENPSEGAGSGNYTFTTPKKSAHYESNTPEHAAILAGVPVNVVINFNFDLASNSKISIGVLPNGSNQYSKLEYGDGDTVIDSNKLTMRRKLRQSAPDGLYDITYNACWPDGSCHDGSFQFAVDRSKVNEYKDMTGDSEVTINMKNIAFEPMSLLIDKGTKVTWVNDDSTVHYVNTDSHPAHTYELNMNSKALESGDSYSYTFNVAGVYPYHCSAHADSMTGSILVK